MTNWYDVKQPEAPDWYRASEPTSPDWYRDTGAIEVGPGSGFNLQSLSPLQWTLDGAPHYDANSPLDRIETLRSRETYSTYRAPRPGAIASLDGTAYLACPHLTGAETVVSSSGTSTVSVSAGRVNFTAGTAWDVVLSDGSVYPLNEERGAFAYNSNDAREFGVWTSADLGTLHTTSSARTSNPANTSGHHTRIHTQADSIVDLRTDDASWEVPGGAVNTGLAYDGTDFWITDWGNGNLLKVSTAGTLLATLNVATGADRLQGLAYDNRGSGSLWVCNFDNNKIQQFDLTGALVSEFAVTQPNGVAIDNYNNLLVVTGDDNSTVKRYNDSGTLLRTIDLSSHSNESLDQVHYDAEFDQIWISANDDRTWVYDPFGTLLGTTWNQVLWIEGIVRIGNTLWSCHNRGHHAAVPNGNRVHETDIETFLAGLATPAGTLHTGQCPHPVTVETPCITGNGTNVYASGALPGLGSLTTITMDVLFSCNSGAASRPRIFEGGAGSGGRFGLYIDTNGRLVCWDGNLDINGEDNLVGGDWHRATAVLTPTQLRLYVDSELVATGPGAFPSVATEQVRLGQYVGGGSFYLSGGIANARIYSGEKTPQEINASPSTDLVEWWPCQDGATRTLIGINGNDLAITGGSEATIWANRCPGLAKDWALLYGGGIGAGGEFVPSRLDGASLVGGGPITLPAGVPGNPYSRLNLDPFDAADFNDRLIPTSYDPATDNIHALVSPANSAFVRDTGEIAIFDDALTAGEIASLKSAWGLLDVSGSVVNNGTSITITIDAPGATGADTHTVRISSSDGSRRIAISAAAGGSTFTISDTAGSLTTSHLSGTIDNLTIDKSGASIAGSIRTHIERKAGDGKLGYAELLIQL